MRKAIWWYHYHLFLPCIESDSENILMETCDLAKNPELMWNNVHILTIHMNVFKTNWNFFLEIGGFTRSFPIVIDKIKRVSSDLKINQLLLILVLSVRLSEWNIMLFMKEILMIFNFNDYGNVAIYAVIAIRKRLCATKFTWKRFAVTAFYTPCIYTTLLKTIFVIIYIFVRISWRYCFVR